jgi:excisionase family DNA binding protein
MTRQPTTYYTPSQVARLLRVDAMTVRKWIKTGILAAEAVTVGERHRYRIAQQTIDAIQGKQE